MKIAYVILAVFWEIVEKKYVAYDVLSRYQRETVWHGWLREKYGEKYMDFSPHFAFR